MAQQYPRSHPNPVGPALGLWTLVVEAFGEDKPYPVLTHTFRGDTEEETLALYELHLSADAMLSGCERRNHYLNFDCTTVARWDSRGS